MTAPKFTLRRDAAVRLFSPTKEEPAIGETEDGRQFGSWAVDDDDWRHTHRYAPAGSLRFYGAGPRIER
jgi:hypothetical protein